MDDENLETNRKFHQMAELLQSEIDSSNLGLLREERFSGGVIGPLIDAATNKSVPDWKKFTIEKIMQNIRDADLYGKANILAGEGGKIDLNNLRVQVENLVNACSKIIEEYKK